MKKIRYTILLILLFNIIIGCQKEIDVSPIIQTTEEKIITDYNFQAISAYDFMLKDTNNSYSVPIQLYLRPFSGVTDNSDVIIQYNSNIFSEFYIENDTLRSGDKKKLKYKDWNKYKKIGIYKSLNAGTHNINFIIECQKVTKNYSLTINAN